MPECGCRTEEVDSQQNCRCWTTFSLAFRHLHTIFKILQQEEHQQQLSMDVQGASLSTTFRLDVQGVSLSTIRSIAVQGVSFSTASKMDVQGVTIFTTSRLTSRVYSSLLPVVWICRGCTFNYQQCERAGCIPVSPSLAVCMF
jgi:hypothetical protein